MRLPWSRPAPPPPDAPVIEEEMCSDCGRCLVRFHTDGTFDLDEQAGVSLAVTGKVLREAAERALPFRLSAVPGTARCYRCHPDGERG